MIGQFQVRKKPYGPLALGHMSKNQIILYLSRNNYQSHIIDILFTSFAQSVRQVMEPRFFIPCFHGLRALRLGHKRKENNSVRNVSCGPRSRLIIQGQMSTRVDWVYKSTIFLLSFDTNAHALSLTLENSNQLLS